VIGQLGELAELACDGRQVYLRYSRGPEADAHQASRDYESGLELPGLSVIPLAPPACGVGPSPTGSPARCASTSSSPTASGTGTRGC